jgi:DNA-binding PadR family transcriptional regulator
MGETPSDELLTPIYATVIHGLMHGELTGAGVRNWLARTGFPYNGPGFYQLMARIEARGLVSSRKNGKPGKRAETVYLVTDSGYSSLRKTVSFYKGFR